ncbi:UPF0255 protein [Escovopsis weberi]|uniref:UPF0255 protein n=1 Tax=Escovopsis weberi TaxID=150374 RepID=A0A0M8N7G6_ESCWE|nr:UPF0255 protein [Escovopsis weberi]
MFQFFKSAFFQFEFLRILAMTSFEGGEINEILITASRIRDQDPKSWFENWSQGGRAANYFRAAQFMLNEGPIGHDGRVLPTLERAIADFRRGVGLLDGDVFFLDIPYEGGVSLPGYLYLPPEGKRLPGGRKTPVLVNAGGGDSTQGEIYFINASTGPGLGYAVLTFDGPGQGVVLRRHGLPMRPHFEVVVGRVLDHLCDFAARHPETGLDLDRVATTGASMGGHLCLRGATDRRVRADAAVLPRMLDYSMLRPDGSDVLRDVRCPVLVTGAGSSFYFDPETTTRRILRGLAHLRDDWREEWIETDEMLGGMQAKIGAFGEPLTTL